MVCNLNLAGKLTINLPVKLFSQDAKCASGAKSFTFWVLAAPQPVLGEDFRGLYRADHTGAILCGDASSRVVCLGLTANNTDKRIYAHSFEQVDEVELYVRPHHGKKQPINTHKTTY